MSRSQCCMPSTAGSWVEFQGIGCSGTKQVNLVHRAAASGTGIAGLSVWGAGLLAPQMGDRVQASGPI